MIRENLIFKSALIISTAVHIGGFGLLRNNTPLFKNNLSSNKENVIVFEIGWVERKLEEKKINKEDRNKGEIGESRAPEEKQQTASFPSQPGASGFAKENRGEVTDNYLLEVRRCIESVKFYPASAKRRLISGNVVISFNIDKNGIAGDILIIKSSGFPVLDDTAKEIVLKANPFPKPSGSGPNHYIQTTIVFTF